MKNIPFLSVILPTYNRKHCITRMIDSILKQNFTDFELIIIDDGSSDNTVEMIEEKYNDCRIKLIKKENGGVSSARNAGISIATGEWITFVDSDDYLLDGFFEDIYQSLEEFDCDVLVYGGYSVNKDGELENIPLFWADKQYGEKERIIKCGKEFLKDFCLLSGNSWGCAKVFKKSLIEEYSLVFDENIHYGEDMLFNTQAYFVARFVATSPKKYYVSDNQGVSLSRGMLTSKKKLNNLIQNYKVLEDWEKMSELFIPFLALNCFRHSQAWIGLKSLDTRNSKKIRKMLKNIDLELCCTKDERIRVKLGRKSVVFALFMSKIRGRCIIIYSKMKIIHPITSPLLRIIRLLRK